MLLSQFFTTELGQDDSSVESIPTRGDYNQNENEVIHHDLIEAIHKDILEKSQGCDLTSKGEGTRFEGIVHLDTCESHYRVKIERLGGYGIVFAVEICNIVHLAPKSSTTVEKSTSNLEGKTSELVPNLNSTDEVPVVCDYDLGDCPLDYSKASSSDEPFPNLNPEDAQIDTKKEGAMLNKIQKVLRGPVDFRSRGTPGFGFVIHKEKRGNILNLFLCHLCAYCCVKKGEMKKHHTAVHLSGKPYGCTFCSYRSTHKSTLRSHVMSRHTGERPFECPQCDYKASQKGLVDKHIMTKHTGEKPFKCPHCEFSSSHSSTVKTHVMFKHTGEKPYECPQCEYRAVQRGHIMRHVKAVHTGEKPFKCPHCDYRAGRNTNVKKHIIAIHTKEKPYKCPKCDFKSSHKGNVSSHLISKHTETKPFACNLCDYKSSCRTGLKRHLLKHKEYVKTKLQCHYCTYTSDRKDHLRTHVTYVHFRGNKILQDSLTNANLDKTVIDPNIHYQVSDPNINETDPDPIIDKEISDPNIDKVDSNPNTDREISDTKVILEPS